jgi:hypothetical protein
VQRPGECRDALLQHHPQDIPDFIPAPGSGAFSRAAAPHALEAAPLGFDRRFAWSTPPADHPGAPDHRDLRLLAPELDFALRVWGRP